MDTPVVLLHGLGGHTSTLWPLEKYIQFCGYKNVYNLYYPVDKMAFDETMDYVDKIIAQHIDKESTEIILIGQSMGGVVSNQLHKKGWQVKFAIYIGSPMHGANLLNQLEATLPESVVEIFYKKPYDYLKEMHASDKPPHPFHTISMGWGFSDFDGCVYKNEVVLDKKHHTHLQWADHRTIFANPRLWHCVLNLLNEHIEN